MVFLWYASRAFLFEFYNWRKGCICYCLFCGFLLKLVLALVFHFLGDPITSSDNVVFKFALVRSLWSALVGILPSYAHGNAAKTLVRFLVEKREMFVQNISEDASEKDKEALSEWAQLVAQVVAVSSSGFTKQFWSIEFGWDDRSLARVWRAYVRTVSVPLSQSYREIQAPRRASTTGWIVELYMCFAPPRSSWRCGDAITILRSCIAIWVPLLW